MNKTVKFKMQLKNGSGKVGTVSLDYIKEGVDKEDLKQIARLGIDKGLFLVSGESVDSLVKAELVTQNIEEIM